MTSSSGTSSPAAGSSYDGSGSSYDGSGSSYDGSGSGSNEAIYCNDGLSCTNDVYVAGIGCQYLPVSCDDGDPCTVDICDEALGCRIETYACEDGDKCTLDYCVATPNGSGELIAQCFQLSQSCCGENVCGNGFVEGAEACDDGNTNGDDGCSADCSTFTPGNGLDCSNAATSSNCECLVTNCSPNESHPSNAPRGPNYYAQSEHTGSTTHCPDPGELGPCIAASTCEPFFDSNEGRVAFDFEPVGTVCHTMRGRLGSCDGQGRCRRDVSELCVAKPCIPPTDCLEVSVSEATDDTCECRFKPLGAGTPCGSSGVCSGDGECIAPSLLNTCSQACTSPPNSCQATIGIPYYNTVSDHCECQYPPTGNGMPCTTSLGNPGSCDDGRCLRLPCSTAPCEGDSPCLVGETFEWVLDESDNSCTCLPVGGSAVPCE